MPRYAHVVVVEAPDPLASWNSLASQLRLVDAADNRALYVGDPYEVPPYDDYSTGAICLVIEDVEVRFSQSALEGVSEP
jgi:hypothetical protein